MNDKLDPMRRVAIYLSSLAIFCAAPIRASFAESSPRGVAIIAGARGVVAHRLAAELAASGLSVEVAATSANARAGAVRVIVPEEAEGTIEVWAERDGHPALVATISPEGPLDARVLRAAELVRALAFPSPPETPPPAEPTSPNVAPPSVTLPITTTSPPSFAGWPAATTPWTPPPPVAFRPPPEEERKDRFDIALALAVGVQAQGAGFSVEPTLRYWPHPRVGVGVFASLPAVGASGIEEPEGTATLRAMLVGAELATAPVRTKRFSLVLAPGVAFANIAVSGEAEAPFLDSDESSFAAIVFARAEGRLRLIDGLHVTAGALGGVAAPPIEIQFASRHVSTFAGLGSFSVGALLEL